MKLSLSLFMNATIRESGADAVPARCVATGSAAPMTTRPRTPTPAARRARRNWVAAAIAGVPVT